MDFIKELVENSKGHIDAFVEALKSKKFSDIVSSASKIIRSMVYYIEKISEELGRVDMALTNEQKHEVVVTALKSIVIEKVNELIDIPFLNEDQERKYIFEPLLNAGIKGAVNLFRSKGWELKNI